MELVIVLVILSPTVTKCSGYGDLLHSFSSRLSKVSFLFCPSHCTDCKADPQTSGAQYLVFYWNQSLFCDCNFVPFFPQVTKIVTSCRSDAVKVVGYSYLLLFASQIIEWIFH